MKRGKRNGNTAFRRVTRPDAFRFIRVGQTGRSWLLAHSAIVAGLAGLAAIGSPSIALADPGCAKGSDGFYHCDGGPIASATGVNVNTFFDDPDIPNAPLADKSWDVVLRGSPSLDPFIVQTNTGVAFTLSVSEDGEFGHVHVEDGSRVESGDGTGFLLDVLDGTVIVDVDGYIAGGYEEFATPSGFLVDGGAADIDMTVSETGEILGYGGNGVRSTSAGAFSLVNYGSIWSEEGDAVSVSDASSVFVGNHSYQSMVGYVDGAHIDSVDGPIVVDNRAGLAFGYTSDGVSITNVTDSGFAEPNIAVYNDRFGVIAGGEDGIYISSDLDSPTEDGIPSIYIGNGVTFGVDDPEGTPTLRQNAGGLIAGGTFAGIEIEGTYTEEDYFTEGSLIVDNSGTFDSWFGFDSEDMTYFEDDIYATFDEDAASTLGYLGYVASDFAGRDTLDLPAGIIGAQYGIAVSNYGGDVVIRNGGYYASGTAVDMDAEASVEFTHEWVKGGQIFGIERSGVAMHDVDGFVRIENGADFDDWEAGDPLRRGGAIVGMGEDGIELSYIWEGVDVINDHGIVYGDLTGIRLDYVGATYFEDDGFYYQSVYVDNRHGEIWGNTEDGVSAHYLYGDLNLRNDGGSLYGADNGLNVAYTEDGNIYVDNADGRIQGFFGDGIRVSDIMSSDFGGYVRIENGAWLVDDESETEYMGDGGLIWGAQSAIEVAAPWADVYSGRDGVILGNGAYDEAVIDLTTASHTYEDDVTFSGYIWNEGLVVGESLIYRDWDEPDGGTLDKPLDAGALASLLTDPFSEAELAGIDNAANDMFDYARSAGAIGRITNSSEDAYSLEDFYHASEDLMVAGRGGATYVGNTGVMVGRVDIIGSDTADLGFDTFDIGNTVENFGVWMVHGPSYFGEDGNGEVYNTGLVQSAFDAGQSESTGMIDLSAFYNGASIESLNLLVSQQQNPSGLVSLVDGGTGDRFSVDGDFVGSYPEETLGSFVALDVGLNSESADMLQVEDWLEGDTGLIFNVVDRGTLGVNRTIDVATAGNVANEDGIEGLLISSNSDGYIEVDGVPSLQDGFYAWYLRQVDSDGQLFQLVSTWSPQAVQTPELITAVQGVWHDTADHVADHIYGNHFPLARGGGGGADMSVGEIPMDDTGPSNGLWAKVVGSWTDSESTVVQTVPPALPVDIDTSLTQNTYAMLGGVDFQPVSTSDGSFRAGVFGGFLQSNVSFDSYGAAAAMTGGTVGAYAAITAGGLYADAEIKADRLDVTYTAPFGSGFVADAVSTSVGVSGNTGYRFDAGAMFFEPLASVAYVDTTIDDISSGTATVSFSNGESLRGGIGVKVGATLGEGEDMTTELSFLGKVWNEFEDANTVTLSDGTNTATFSDDISGLFGEVRATGTVYTYDRSFSAFASAGVKFNEEFTTLDGKLGVRKGF